jgi:hypothetical protein
MPKDKHTRRPAGTSTRQERRTIIARVVQRTLFSNRGEVPRAWRAEGRFEKVVLAVLEEGR